MQVSEVTVDKLIQAYQRHNYIWYEESHKLNIFGVRDTSQVNSFNDVIGYCYYNDGIPNFAAFQATTDPGLKMLKAPMNSKGCAILVEGQYIDGWKKGKHQGKYDALVQNKAVPVYRDNNKDGVLDCVRGINGANLDVGFHGINLHRAGSRSVQVDGWSAGCQVLAIEEDFKKLMSAVNLSIKHGFQTFTYTLLTLSQFRG